MVALAVIPARGGSKRIAKKNIKTFHGQPIIAYSIATALESRLFARVIVSTDDKEIAVIAKKCGAEVPFMRPTNLADDYTGTNAVVKSVLLALREQGQSYAHACCIYATAPFLRVQDLQTGYDLLKNSDKDYAFSVTTYAHPVQRALRITAEHTIAAMDPEHMRSRSQDLEPAYHDAAQFYWGCSDAFLSDKPLFSSAAIPVVIERAYVQDIDTLEDWQRAELMYQAL